MDAFKVQTKIILIKKKKKYKNMNAAINSLALTVVISLVVDLMVLITIRYQNHLSLTHLKISQGYRNIFVFHLIVYSVISELSFCVL